MITLLFPPPAKFFQQLPNQASQAIQVNYVINEVPKILKIAHEKSPRINDELILGYGWRVKDTVSNRQWKQAA